MSMEVPIDEKYNFDKYRSKGSEPDKQPEKKSGTSVSENKKKPSPAPNSETPPAPPAEEKGFLDTLADTGKAVQDGWGQSLTTLDPFGLIDDNGYGDTGTESKRLISTQHDFEKERDEALKQWEGIDQSLFPPKNSFHKIFGQDICTENAIIKCAMGSVFSKLHVVIPRRAAIGTTIKNRVAFITDFVPGANFDGFGACWNILNPVVLANTLAASALAGTFVLTPAPCMATMMPTPWIPMQPSVLGNKSLLLLTQTCMCSCWGLGFINIVHCGQGLDCSAPGFSDGKGNIDYHAVLGLAANIVGVGAGALAGGAKAATAMSNAAKAAQAAATSAKITKAIQMAQKLKTASIVADMTSTGMTVGDGVWNIAEGNTASGATELITAGAGIALGQAGKAGKKANDALGQVGKANKKAVTNQARNAVPNEVRNDFDNITQIADNPEQIKQIVQNNPEIYGGLSTDEAALNRVVNPANSVPHAPNKGKPAKIDTNNKPDIDQEFMDEFDDKFDSIIKPDKNKPDIDQEFIDEFDDKFDSILKPDKNKPDIDQEFIDEFDDKFDSIIKPDKNKPDIDQEFIDEFDDKFDSIIKPENSNKPATDKAQATNSKVEGTSGETTQKPTNNDAQKPEKQTTDTDNTNTPVNEQNKTEQPTNETNNTNTDATTNGNHTGEEQNSDKTNKWEAAAEGAKPALTLDGEIYGNAAGDYDNKKNKKKENSDASQSFDKYRQ